MSKHPTEEEFKQFDGNHCSKIWERLPFNWTCPGCKRNKKQIMKWGKPKKSKNVQDQWLVSLAKHHDHIFEPDCADDLTFIYGNLKINSFYTWSVLYSASRYEPYNENDRSFKNWLKDDYDDLLPLVRFRPILICGNCNASDGIAKKNLNLPFWFTFSIFEISQFITSIPNGSHKLNLNKAKEIYEIQNVIWLNKNKESRRTSFINILTNIFSP